MARVYSSASFWGVRESARREFLPPVVNVIRQGQLCHRRRWASAVRICFGESMLLWSGRDKFPMVSLEDKCQMTLSDGSGLANLGLDRVSLGLKTTCQSAFWSVRGYL